MNGDEEWVEMIRENVVIRQDGPRAWAVVMTGSTPSHPNPPTTVYDGLHTQAAAIEARRNVVAQLIDSAGESPFGPSEVTADDFNRWAREAHMPANVVPFPAGGGASRATECEF